MKMISKALIIAATSLMAFAAQAAPKTVEVVYMTKTPVTQVVVNDGSDTFVVTTGQVVEDKVLVTENMAKAAKPFSPKADTFKKITSVKQIPNGPEPVVGDGKMKATGLMGIHAADVSMVYTVVFKDGKGYKVVETVVAPVAGKLTLTDEMQKAVTDVNLNG